MISAVLAAEVSTVIAPNSPGLCQLLMHCYVWCFGKLLWYHALILGFQWRYFHV